jgi:hypothetical protein
MNRSKCNQCGLVNAATDEQCRRCGALLLATTEEAELQLEPDVEETDEPVKKRSIRQRNLWIAGTTVAILVMLYVSLIVSSNGLNSEQQAEVQKAIDVLDQKGFGSEVFVLRHLVSYRATDNWWNSYVGHRDAYAATNFPFEVVTLYPEFFELSTDDNERAAMLLHEAYHLFGHGEEAALEGVWRDKQRLDWTAEKYGRSRVWNATRQLTISGVPKFFQCGADGHSDCFQ